MQLEILVTDDNVKWKRDTMGNIRHKRKDELMWYSAT